MIERTGSRTAARPVQMDAAGSAASGRSTGRLAWLDFARGSVVLAVVLMHVSIYQYLPLVEGANPAAFSIWTAISGVLEDVRMPALLVISGWLASNQVKRGLGDAKTRKRIWTNGYLYVLWLCLYAVITVAVGGATMSQSVVPEQVLGELLIPYSTLWFLAALVWYVLFYAGLRRLPVPLVLGVALAVSAFTWTVLDPGMGLWVRIPQYLVFFGLGVHFKDLWERVARRPGYAVGGGAALFVLASVLTGELGRLELPTYPGDFLASLGGVALVLGVATVATRTRTWASAVMEWIGRHTASIYVLHFPVLMLLTFVTAGPLFDLPREMIASPELVWAYPLVATAAIAGASAGVHAAADRLRLGWLFRLPRPAWPQLSYVARKSSTAACSPASV